MAGASRLNRSTPIIASGSSSARSTLGGYSCNSWAWCLFFLVEASIYRFKLLHLAWFRFNHWRCKIESRQIRLTCSRALFEECFGSLTITTSNTCAYAVMIAVPTMHVYVQKKATLTDENRFAKGITSIILYLRFWRQIDWATSDNHIFIKVPSTYIYTYMSTCRMTQRHYVDLDEPIARCRVVGLCVSPREYEVKGEIKCTFKCRNRDFATRIERRKYRPRAFRSIQA
jgi:hypothetical protein